MIDGLERGEPARANLPVAGMRRKVLIVTNHFPGRDAGFEKSGHAQYLQSFIDHFVDRGFDTVLAVHTPRLNALWFAAERLRCRIASPALMNVGGRLFITDLRAVGSACAWMVYARLPRPFQSLGAFVRSAVRKARGYVHVLGVPIGARAIEFMQRTVAAERPDTIVFDGVFNAYGPIGDAEHWVLTHEVKYQRAESFHERGVRVSPAGFSRDAERTILAKAQNVIAIQWDDATEFERLLPGAQIVVVPVSIDATKRSAGSAAVTGRCLFVGSGSFHNLDGIRWFLAACWPTIRAQLPTATLDIFGTVCYRLGDVPAGVTLHGMVQDLGRAYASASLAIVPLQIGSGLKVKLVEALSYGMPVVTTPVGAQGLSSFVPRPFLIGDTAAAFAEHCITVLTDAGRADDLAAVARRCAQQFTPSCAFAQFATATADAAEQSPVRICVAIPTFRRIEPLGRLLAALAAQTIDSAIAHVSVVVFDNDSAPTAQPLVTATRLDFPYPLEYEHVCEAGLVAVRNRALHVASAGFDYIAMIDDDEEPEPNWLRELLHTARSSGAHVVVGPVSPIVSSAAPPWVSELRALETPLRPDGALLRDGWTCNALVELRAVNERGVRFDPALNFAGGEDQLFFRQLIAAGATIAFAARARVNERIGAERLTVRFHVLRAFRRGNSLSFCERRMNGRVIARGLRLAKAIGLIARGIVLMPTSLGSGGERNLVLGACDVASGLGMLAGLVGSMYQAYRRD